jgi:uncharacterized protein YcgI (DUF1989 family)
MTLFKGARIEAGRDDRAADRAVRAGRRVVLRAEMDVIVVIANCPHVLDPRDLDGDAAARDRVARPGHASRRSDPQRDARGPARLPQRRRLFPPLNKN